MANLKNNFFLTIILLVSCSLNSEKKDNIFCKKELGLNIKLEKLLYKFDQEGIRGKGISFTKYKFLKTGQELFIDLGKYPNHYEIRKDWNLIGWHKTPVAEKRIFQLLEDYSVGDEKYNKELLKLKTVALLKDNYVSFFYKENEDGEIYAVEMFLIDLYSDNIYIYYLKV